MSAEFYVLRTDAIVPYLNESTTVRLLESDNLTTTALSVLDNIAIRDSSVTDVTASLTDKSITFTNEEQSSGGIRLSVPDSGPITPEDATLRLHSTGTIELDPTAAGVTRLRGETDVMGDMNVVGSITLDGSSTVISGSEHEDPDATVTISNSDKDSMCLFIESKQNAAYVSLDSVTGDLTIATVEPTRNIVLPKTATTSVPVNIPIPKSINTSKIAHTVLSLSEGSQFDDVQLTETSDLFLLEGPKNNPQTSVVVTGFAGGYQGRSVELVYDAVDNESQCSPIIISNLDRSSAVGNRVACSHGKDVVMNPDPFACVRLRYLSGKWIVVYSQ